MHCPDSEQRNSPGLAWASKAVKKFAKSDATFHLLATCAHPAAIEFIRSVGAVRMCVANSHSTNAGPVIAFELIRLTNDWCTELTSLIR